MVLDLMNMEFFSLPYGSGISKNIILFGVDHRCFEHADNRRKIIILGNDLTDGSGDTIITLEAK